MKKIITSPEEMLKFSCDLTSGRGLNCKDRMGGLKYIFLANYDASVAHQFSITAKVITDTPTLTVYRYDVEDGAAGNIDTINASVENGTRFYEQVTTVNLMGIDAAMQAELDLITAAKLWVWGADYQGNVYLYGQENGCDVTGGEVNTGLAKGDKSGYQLTITGRERLSTPLNTPYTNFPFDTLANITVDPAFPVVP